jgi:type III pantothenate kinase
VSWLLLDAGNTALKWTLVSGALAQWPEIAPMNGAEPQQGYLRGSIAIDAAGLPEAIAQACAGSPVLGDAPAPAEVFGCAVTATTRVDAIDAALQAAGAGAAQWLGASGRFAHDGIDLRNAYRDPGQLGADRWHALIGARARFPRGNLVVVCAGTATTVDGLLADGTFCGGVIGPGVELMRASLAGGTARLPLAGGQYTLHPDNTDDAIRTGILDAQLGLIDRRVRRLREAAGAQPLLVVSGGHGAALASHLANHHGSSGVALEPDLVLRGLWHRARAHIAAATAPPAPMTASRR